MLFAALVSRSWTVPPAGAAAHVDDVIGRVDVQGIEVFVEHGREGRIAAAGLEAAHQRVEHGFIEAVRLPEWIDRLHGGILPDRPAPAHWRTQATGPAHRSIAPGRRVRARTQGSAGARPQSRQQWPPTGSTGRERLS